MQLDQLKQNSLYNCKFSGYSIYRKSNHTIIGLISNGCIISLQKNVQMKETNSVKMIKCSWSGCIVKKRAKKVF